jgi:hypothetical protein
MSTIIKNEASQDFERPTIDEFLPGCLVSIKDMGMQTSTWQGKTSKKHKIVLTWEIGYKMKSGPDAGKNYLIAKKYTRSLHPKSLLYTDLLAWIGPKNINTDVAAKGFDIDKLLGVPCKIMLTLTPENDEGKSYINILKLKLGDKGTFVPTRKGECPKWVTESIEASALQDSTPDVASTETTLEDVASLL